MTTIAWDGKIIAADTQSCFNDSRHTASKLFDLSRYIIGFTGDISFGIALAQWLEGLGPQPEYEPNGWGGIALVYDKKQERMYLYECPGKFVFVQDPYIAIGSGSKIAETELKAESDARGAIQAAIDGDVYTGGSIMWLKAPAAPFPLEPITPDLLRSMPSQSQESI